MMHNNIFINIFYSIIIQYSEYDIELAQKKKEKTPAHPMPEQLRIWLGHIKHSNPIATHRMCRCV